MRESLVKLDVQIREALAIGRSHPPLNPSGIKKILCCGMGGSAIGADILRAIVRLRSPVIFEVFRGGLWPKWAGPDTLVVFSSYSGNTNEVLNLIPKAKSLKCRMAGVSSGGRLLDIARKEKMPCFRIPGGLLPRCAVGYLTFSLLPLVENAGGFRVPRSEIKEMLSLLRQKPEREARILARRIKGKSLYVYAAAGLMEPVAVRWRAQFEENAKTLASYHVIPEMFHNEIEGWRYPVHAMKRSAAIFLIDRDDPAWIRSKRSYVQRHIRRQGGEVLQIRSRGKSALARIFSAISLGDWTSYELALVNRVDPEKIPVIENLKKIA